MTDGFDSTTKSLRTLFPGARLGTASATRSRSSRRNCRRSRRRSVKPCARGCTPWCTGPASARAYACLRWASGYAILSTTSPPRLGQPTGNAYGAGSRTRRWAGMRSHRPADAGDEHLARSSAYTIARKLFSMKGFHHPGAASRRFSRAWRTCTTWSRINGAPSMPGSVGWRWKAGEYRHATGSSMSKSSPPEGFAERCYPLPLNSGECEIFRVFFRAADAPVRCAPGEGNRV